MEKGMHTVQYVHSAPILVGMTGPVPVMANDAYADPAEKTPRHFWLVMLSALLLPVLSPMYSFAADRPAVTDATVVATWDGGKVTVGQAKAKARELTSRRNVYTFSSPESMYETAIRQSALSGILLKKAADLGLEKAPGWPAAEKIIENRALYSLMIDEVWLGIKPTQLEMEKFAAENAHMLMMPGGEKSGGVDLPIYAPTEKEMITWHLRSEKAQPLMESLAKDAQAKYSWDCPSPEEWMKAKDDAVLVRVGTLEFTKKDMRALSELTSSPVEWCSQFYLLGNGDDSMMPQGELARSKGYAKRSRYAAVLKAEREAWLIWIARTRLLDEWLKSYSPSEKELKEKYDRDYDAWEPQTIIFDAVISPIVTGDSHDQAAATETAKESAEGALAAIKAGKSFEDVLKERPELRYLPAQGRTVNPDFRSEFIDRVAGLLPREVAGEIIDDYGGFCIVRVLENRPRRKTPFEYMRGAVLGDMRFEYHRTIRQDVDGAILQKNKFSLDKDVLAELIRKDG